MSKKKDKSAALYPGHEFFDIITEKLYRKYKSRHRDKTRRQQRLRKKKHREDGGQYE